MGAQADEPPGGILHALDTASKARHCCNWANSWRRRCLGGHEERLRGIPVARSHRRVDVLAELHLDRLELVLDQHDVRLQLGGLGRALGRIRAGLRLRLYVFEHWVESACSAR